MLQSSDWRETLKPPRRRCTFLYLALRACRWAEQVAMYERQINKNTRMRKAEKKSSVQTVDSILSRRVQNCGVLFSLVLSCIDPFVSRLLFLFSPPPMLFRTQPRSALSPSCFILALYNVSCLRERLMASFALMETKSDFRRSSTSPSRGSLLVPLLFSCTHLIFLSTAPRVSPFFLLAFVSR